jgi:uncharacterized repeat protein (TIGR01451 family)
MGNTNPSGSISVAKTANVTTVSAVGQRVTYTFTVANTDDQTLSDVDVSDVQAARRSARASGPLPARRAPTAPSSWIRE